MKYILGIDQSTQGTKAVLVDETGKITGRCDYPHKQMVNRKGWVSHDPEEIYQNVKKAVRDVIRQNAIEEKSILAIGISNQRETTAIWDRAGRVLNYAVVWQCSRAKEITDAMQEHAGEIKEKTGLHLSPYFPAAKMAWLLEHTEHLPPREELCIGTMDSWLVFKMTHGASFKTDYSNASRTQLFNLHTLTWDKELCEIFHVPMECLPEVCDSNSFFGKTDLDGILPAEIPIYGVLGDSHAALFGQGCHREGMVKATYGTGSSVMMNTGEKCIESQHGLVTSLAWGIDGKVSYVLEGNINYSGAVITWLKDDLNLIQSAGETAEEAKKANEDDHTILVPAFSGLSAPYWKDHARALLYGMTRTTGKKEIIKAALDSIVLQITDLLDAMKKDSGIAIPELRADGGPSRNSYLMQAQSDYSDIMVSISDAEEVSALGASYLAGIRAGVFRMDVLFLDKKKVRYYPEMNEEKRRLRLNEWRDALEMVG